MTVKDALIVTQNSSFRQEPSNGVTIPIKTLNRFFQSITLYSNYDNSSENINSEIFFSKIIPGFQRENNKWKKSMKIKFMENVLKGHKSEIKLFKMDDEGDAQIIDGLQRLTSIIDFMENKFPVFDGLFFKDISDQMSLFRSEVILKVILFKEWKEVAKFYIDMNENITHSKSDIEKAKKWFFANKQITL